ncbi:MAG: exonuclease SbcD, partial [Oscillospiraceae bacterium]|nr:exonuclease SbcD [Oscillospiraceae bacterium]
MKFHKIFTLYFAVSWRKIGRLTVKIIHTSDWHIGKFVNEYSMLEDQRYFLNQLIDLIKEEKADALVIAGDIYDRSVPSAEAVSLVDEIFCRMIDELHIPILSIAGNHDSKERLSFVNKLFEKSGLYIEGRIDKEVKKVALKDDFGKVNFFLLPYIEPSQIRPLFPDENIKTFDDSYRALMKNISKEVDSSQRNLLIAHGFFAYLNGEEKENEPILSESEVSVGGSDLVNARHFDDFDYVALGHL